MPSTLEAEPWRRLGAWEIKVSLLTKSKKERVQRVTSMR